MGWVGWPWKKVEERQPVCCLFRLRWALFPLLPGEEEDRYARACVRVCLVSC